MNNTTKHMIATFLAGAGLLATALTANAAYHPGVGDLFYNGAYHIDSYMGWSPVGPFSVSEPGYEHDLWVHDSNFFITTCTSFSNLPNAYDDCNTAGIFDPNGPVFQLRHIQRQSDQFCEHLFWRLEFHVPWNGDHQPL